MFYTRNDVEFTPGTFRVRGDVVEIFPAYYEDQALPDRVLGRRGRANRAPSTPSPATSWRWSSDMLTIYPAKQFVTPKDQVDRAVAGIEEELRWRLAILRNEGNLIAAQRIEQRTLFDIEMIKEIGYCSGIENYSRHMDGREPGTRPYCLLDYFDLNLQKRLDAGDRREPRECAAGARACTTATARASSTSSSTASGCRRRWTTGR